MADYNKATNFASKDTLPTGNAGKIVKGTEIDNEFNAIASAIASKADLSSPAFTGTPTAPTALSGSNTTQLATTAFVSSAISAINSVPSGGIIMWSGTIAAIPSGWFLCNGSNGTPDLRDRFVVGAGSTYAVGATGGSKDAIVVSHTHTATSTVTDPGHNHSIPLIKYSGTLGSQVHGAGDWGSTSTTSSTTGISVSTAIASTGSSGTNANLPPYYALAFIMKS